MSYYCYFLFSSTDIADFFSSLFWYLLFCREAELVYCWSSQLLLTFTLDYVVVTPAAMHHYSHYYHFYRYYHHYDVFHLPCSHYDACYCLWLCVVMLDVLIIMTTMTTTRCDVNHHYSENWLKYNKIIIIFVKMVMIIILLFIIINFNRQQ